MIDNLTMVAVREAESAVERLTAEKPDASIEERLRAAFAVTRDHWLQTNEDQRFKAGVGGVLLKAAPEEQARINAELRNLQTLGAAMAGVPVDFAGLDTVTPAIGLLRIWREK